MPCSNDIKWLKNISIFNENGNAYWTTPGEPRKLCVQYCLNMSQIFIVLSAEPVMTTCEHKMKKIKNNAHISGNICLMGGLNCYDD